MTTSTTNTDLLASVEPEITKQTRNMVNFMVSLNRPALQEAMAQVIAGAIADSDCVAMQRFAGSGELDTEALLDELDRVEVPYEQEAWVDTLARYVLFGQGGRS